MKNYLGLIVLASCVVQPAAPPPQGPGYAAPPPAGGTVQAGCTFKAAELQQRAPGTAYVVQCPAGCLAVNWNVWGSGPYTADSGVCRAALHAGAIADQTGGSFQLVFDRGQPAYRGSVQNGIQTQDYGSWGESFWIQPLQAAAPAPAAPPPAY